ALLPGPMIKNRVKRLCPPHAPYSRELERKNRNSQELQRAWRLRRCRAKRLRIHLILCVLEQDALLRTPKRQNLFLSRSRPRLDATIPVRAEAVRNTKSAAANKGVKSFCLAAASSLLYILCFPNFNFSYGAWVTLIPLTI